MDGNKVVNEPSNSINATCVFIYITYIYKNTICIYVYIVCI